MDAETWNETSLNGSTYIEENYTHPALAEKQYRVYNQMLGTH